MFEWISVKDRLPEKSGDVLVAHMPAGYMDVMHYSARYRLFNAHDDLDEQFVKRHAVRTVTHWAQLPELPKED